MKILFITANRVGDAVLTTGLLAWLERTYPEALFTVACGPYGADVFRALPRLERLIIMKKQKRHGHWIDLWKQCIGTRWDIIVDLRNSAVSRLLRAGKRFIHSNNNGAHKVQNNAAVLKLETVPDPYIWLTTEAIAQADKIMPAGRPVLAFGPAANWTLKQWPIASFTKLMQTLTAPHGALADAAVLVVAAEHEREQIEPLLAAIPDDRRIEVIGLDLQTAAACLKRARLYVGNDSGLMHLSAALGTPTLGLFGPGFPEVYGPWGKNCAVAQTPESRETLLALRPVPATLMQSLSVESVVAAAEALLARTAG